MGTFRAGESTKTHVIWKKKVIMLSNTLYDTFKRIENYLKKEKVEIITLLV